MKLARAYCHVCDKHVIRDDKRAQNIVYLECPKCYNMCEVWSIGRHFLNEDLVAKSAVWSTPKGRRG